MVVNDVNSNSNAWEKFKTLVTFGSLIVAGLAFWQADDASERALALQQKIYDRSEAYISFSSIQIMMKADDETKYRYYPESFGEKVSIPSDDFSSRPQRYVAFNLANRGTSAVYVDNIGLGTSAGFSSWAQNGGKWCKDKTRADFTADCPRELLPNSENRYVFALHKGLLQHLEPEWQKDGLEVCVRVEAYGTTCERSWARLPDNFKAIA